MDSEYVEGNWADLGIMPSSLNLMVRTGRAETIGKCRTVDGRETIRYKVKRAVLEDRWERIGRVSTLRAYHSVSADKPESSRQNPTERCVEDARTAVLRQASVECFLSQIREANRPDLHLTEREVLDVLCLVWLDGYGDGLIAMLRQERAKAQEAAMASIQRNRERLKGGEDQNTSGLDYE